MNELTFETADDDLRFMKAAMEEARAAAAEDEIPIGAVVAMRGKIIGRGHNMTQRLGDVTAHAEMIAITSAANTIGSKYLPEATLYVTVEPCLMCAGAIAWSQIGRIVYGADDPKRGYRVYTPGSPFHPKASVEGGLMREQCSELMTQFFKTKR